MFQQITLNANKIYQLDFLKVIVLSCSTKAAITGSFRRVLIVFYLLKSQQNWKI